MLIEDARKTALKKGLRQLTLEQLERVACYPHPMALDKFNYLEGKFCPLAVGLGLHEIVREPTQEKVYAILALAGYTVNNTWEVEGNFYTTDRDRDLKIALSEVMLEKVAEEWLLREGSRIAS